VWAEYSLTNIDSHGTSMNRRDLSGIARLKRDGTRAETRFGFQRNGRVHLNRPGDVSSVDYWQSRSAHQR